MSFTYPDHFYDSTCPHDAEILQQAHEYIASLPSNVLSNHLKEYNVDTIDDLAQALADERIHNSYDGDEWTGDDQ